MTDYNLVFSSTTREGLRELYQKEIRERFGAYTILPILSEDTTNYTLRILSYQDFFAYENRNAYNSKGEFLSVAMYYTHARNGGAISRKWAPGLQYKYWTFGCLHTEHTSKEAGRCYRKYECNTCGYSWHIDSSD